MSKANAAERLAWLRAQYGHLDGEQLLEPLVRDAFAGRIAVLTSFGAESAVLLDVVAAVEPGVPVIFLETGKHFTETLIYRDRLAEQLGLTDVRSVAPDPTEIAEEDPTGDLNQRDPDACCAMRKVRPLARALTGFDAWITGRKRVQSSTRAGMPTIEAEDGRVKVNPLARWNAKDVENRFRSRRLARHTLETVGYKSIGCEPCTQLPPDPSDPRSGRWAQIGKTECGIHGATWARSGNKKS